MPGTRRTRPLPPNWRTLRNATIERDGHQCTWTEPDGSRCPETHHLEVDHIGDPDDHTALRTLCTWHHAKRTAAQAVAARLRNPRRRPTPRHPGLI